jgi:hypothetical protein
MTELFVDLVKNMCVCKIGYNLVPMHLYPMILHKSWDYCRISPCGSYRVPMEALHLIGPHMGEL